MSYPTLTETWRKAKQPTNLRKLGFLIHKKCFTVWIHNLAPSLILNRSYLLMLFSHYGHLVV